jgi:hypothetical protein
MYDIVVIPITKSDETLSIGVNGTANAYSHSFCFEYGKNFALDLIATSDGVVDIDVYLYESDTLPTTEGTLAAWYVIPENMSKIADITDEVHHIIPISPVVCKYGVLLFDGQGSNDATTVIAGKLYKTIPL